MKSWIKFGLAVLIVGFLTNLLFGKSGQAPEIISEHLKAGALVIDVRTAGEFSAGHIQNAINIPYDVIAKKIAAQEKDPSKPILVYCRSGNRSARAKQSLIQVGYTNVVDGGAFSTMKKLHQP